MSGNNLESSRLNPENPEEGENTEKEYKFLAALFQLSAHDILKRIKGGDYKPTVREIAVLAEMRKIASRGKLDARIHFKICDACLFDSSCSLFIKGGECRFDLSTKIENPEDALGIMRELMTIQTDRVKRGLLLEMLEGGAIDRQVSEEILTFFEMAEKMKVVMDNDPSLTLKFKGRGAISSLFQDLLPDTREDEINITPKKEAIPVRARRIEDEEADPQV